MSSALPKLLAIDDDKEWLAQIPLILKERCDVHTCSTIDQALFAIEEQFFDIILLDLNFEEDERTGLDVFHRIAASDRGADVIVVSAETDPEKLVEVINAGVTRFIAKPAVPAKVREAIDSALVQREIRLRSINMASGENSQVLIGSSVAMQKLRVEINRVIKSSVRDVLIVGATGTGKEVVAKLIAGQCDPSKRFIPINCGAISDGIAESELFGHVRGAFTGADRERPSAFEVAGGGFIFFDEIGEMPMNQQVKLLRVLQERKVQRVGSHDQIAVNFRTISATHVDLEKAIIEKKFREDLYYRIARDRIRIPALRERLEDVPELIHYFLAQTPEKRRKTITNQAVELLKAYTWPGNVRQLQSVVEILESRTEDKIIREGDICQVIPEVAKLASSRFTKALVGKYGAYVIQGERDRFRKAIIEAGEDRNLAAEKLGLSRATFFRKAKALGLVKERRKRQTSQLEPSAEEV